MIVNDDETPGWIRELSRFLPLKNLIFVYGNILDLVSYPVKREGTEEVYWTETVLQTFFERFLAGLEYEVIGFLDPIDGLTFVSPVMEENYKKIQKGKDIKPVPQDTCCGRPPATQAGRDGSEPKAQSGKTGESDPNRILGGIRTALANPFTPCVFVVNLASRLVTSPAQLAKAEREMFTKVLKSCVEAQEVVRSDMRWNNAIILICDKLNDLPAFLYLNNPRARSIYIPRPDTADRTRFIKRSYRNFYGAETERTETPPELASLFAALTEGLSNYELKSLVSLSIKEKVPVSEIQNICERYKYGITTSEWDKIGQERLDNAENVIRSHIKGQDAAVAAVLDIVKRARIGLSAGTSNRSSRPRGVLFFAGPTGVGKTEMAKALAELLFGQEERCIRFDMSEYSAPHSDQKLLGAPPGYVGYEEGGQLTNAVRERPFSILLFDEIEKAHGSIFDKFLQILDDGRLTDGKGNTVYFSESIIIFTSNLGTVTGTGLSGNCEVSMVTPDMPYQKIRETILDAIRGHFNFVLGRPEILNRFGDNFVVFDFIKPPLDEEIVDLLLGKLVKAARENNGIDISIDGPVREKLIFLARNNLQHGGRGIRNATDSCLVNPLNRVLFDKDVKEGSRVRLTALSDLGEDAHNRFVLDIKVNHHDA